MSTWRSCRPAACRAGRSHFPGGAWLVAAAAFCTVARLHRRQLPKPVEVARCGKKGAGTSRVEEGRTHLLQLLTWAGRIDKPLLPAPAEVAGRRCANLVKASSHTGWAAGHAMAGPRSPTRPSAALGQVRSEELLSSSTSRGCSMVMLQLLLLAPVKSYLTM